MKTDLRGHRAGLHDDILVGGEKADFGAGKRRQGVEEGSGVAGWSFEMVLAPRGVDSSDEGGGESASSGRSGGRLFLRRSYDFGLNLGRWTAFRVYWSEESTS